MSVSKFSKAADGLTIKQVVYQTGKLLRDLIEQSGHDEDVKQTIQIMLLEIVDEISKDR